MSIQNNNNEPKTMAQVIESAPADSMLGHLREMKRLSDSIQDEGRVTAADILPIIRDNGTDASEMVQDLVDEELYGNDDY